MCKTISTEGLATPGPAPEILYRSASGSLSLCPICRTFAMTFGPLHLSLDSQAVLALAQVLEKLSAVKLEDGQCHKVRLGGTPATLLLARQDLAALRRIVLEGQQAAITVAAEAVRRSAPEAWVH